MKFILLLASLACTIACTSCRTAWPMQGMVYDQDCRPVSGYRLSLDGRHTATTDINGRFAFAGAKYGTHTVTGTDARYLPLGEKCSFLNRTEVLHIKLTSIDRLYCLIDDKISEGDFAAARKSLDGIPETERDAARYRLYGAILAFRMTGDQTALKDIR